MTPSGPPAPGFTRRLQAVVGKPVHLRAPSVLGAEIASDLCCIDFAVDLCAKIRHGLHDVAASGILLADLNHHSQSLMASGSPHPGAASIDRKTARDVETQGRNLWNLATRLKRDGDAASKPKEQRYMLLRTRMLGFQLLEIGRAVRRRHKRDVEVDTLYLINLAVSLGRNCLADDEVDLDAARFVLQRMAEYMERLKTIPDVSLDEEGKKARARFEAEYLAMRTALSWKEGRLDVAEHMFSKGDVLRQVLDVPSAEIVADTLHHIGMDLAGKGDYTLAIRWLRRGYEVLNHQPLDRLSAHGLESRLAICQALFRSLLDEGLSETAQEARNLVSYLETEIGDVPVVLHWRMELLQKSPGEAFDLEAYVSLLRRMIRSFDFSDASFDFLLHHVRALKERSARLACGLLDELLQRHVLQSNKREWLNKIVVWRVWISTSEAGTAGGSDTDNSPTEVRSLFDSIRDNHPGPLRPDVAAAVHSLIWKKVQALFVERNHRLSEAWCLVALHEVVSSSGEAYLAVFHRKLIICATSSNDVEKARSAFRSMPEAAQNHVLTRFLMFKVSLQSWDHELGRDCIDQISKTKDKRQSRDYLYTCLQEAQQAGDQLCALAALRCVAENWVAGEGQDGNLSAVLRCAIHLISSIARCETEGAGEHQARGFSEDLCRMFETAALHAKANARDHNGNRVFTVKELNWFRKTAYNTGAKELEKWDLGLLIRLFRTCLAFNECYPRDMPLTDVSERALMAMRCHFVIAVARVATARTSDAVDEQVRLYSEARHHICEFDVLLETEVGSQEQEEHSTKDLLAKLSTLYVFDFEAVTCLKRWDSLNEIVRKAQICKDEAMYKAMGDCLLRSKAPGKTMFSTMKLIINGIYELEGFDHERLAKYIRCVFQAILPLDDEAAIQLFDQALQIAKAATTALKRFPDPELEWLVATAFNHSVEFYSRGEEASCHRWALKAMSLADCIHDGGGLRNALRTNFAKLRFEPPTS